MSSKTAMFSNPEGRMAKKKSRGSKKGSGGNWFTNPSSVASKSTGGVAGKVLTGLLVAAGAIGIGILGQNLVPMSWRDTANKGALVFGALAVAAGVGLSKLSSNAKVKAFGNYLTIGGVAAAAMSVATQPVLSATKFNLLGDDYGYFGAIDPRVAIGMAGSDQRIAVPAAPRAGLAGVDPRVAVAAGVG